MKVSHSKRYKPGEFRAEFIKYSYQQILKNKDLETKAEKDKAKMMKILKEFSNDAIDDPYKDKKLKQMGKQRSSVTMTKKVEGKKKSPPKVLKPVIPLMVTLGKTPDFGKTMSDMKKT